MTFSSIKYVLWFLAPALQVGILWMMRKRDLHKQFPFFQTYTVLQVLSVPVLFAIYEKMPNQYFYAYWVNSALSIFLGFAVIHEVFGFAIRPYVGLRGLGMMLFRWAGVVLIIVSTLMAFSGVGSGWARVAHEIASLERSVRVVQCGMLLFIVMFASYLGLAWRNFACGIAFGFGLVAVSDMILFTLRAQLGPYYSNSLSLAISAMYNVSVML